MAWVTVELSDVFVVALEAFTKPVKKVWVIVFNTFGIFAAWLSTVYTAFPWYCLPRGTVYQRRALDSPALPPGSFQETWHNALLPGLVS